MVKSQAIIGLLAQFLGEREFPLDNEVLGETARTEVTEEQWVIKFDGSFLANSGGAGMVLYHKGEEIVVFSMKLEFLCSNSTVEYEAFLSRLATALEMGIKYLKVIGDSNLVVRQAKGSFSLKEPSLALYRTHSEE